MPKLQFLLLVNIKQAIFYGQELKFIYLLDSIFEGSMPVAPLQLTVWDDHKIPNQENRKDYFRGTVSCSETKVLHMNSSQALSSTCVESLANLEVLIFDWKIEPNLNFEERWPVMKNLTIAVFHNRLRANYFLGSCFPNLRTLQVTLDPTDANDCLRSLVNSCPVLGILIAEVKKEKHISKLVLPKFKELLHFVFLNQRYSTGVTAAPTVFEGWQDLPKLRSLYFKYPGNVLVTQLTPTLHPTITHDPIKMDDVLDSYQKSLNDTNYYVIMNPPKKNLRVIYTRMVLNCWENNNQDETN